MGTRSQVLAVQFGGAVRFTAAVSSLKWAYQPMFVEPLSPAAAIEEVRPVAPGWGSIMIGDELGLHVGFPLHNKAAISKIPNLSVCSASCSVTTNNDIGVQSMMRILVPKASVVCGFSKDENAEEEDEEGQEKAGSDSESGADPESGADSGDGSVVEHTSSDTSLKEAPVAQSEGSVEAPLLAAPDLFDAVAEEWQRLRLAMQDVY